MKNNIISFPQRKVEQINEVYDEDVKDLLNEITVISNAVGCILIIINEGEDGKYTISHHVIGDEDNFDKLCRVAADNVGPILDPANDH